MFHPRTSDCCAKPRSGFFNSELNFCICSPAGNLKLDDSLFERTCVENFQPLCRNLIPDTISFQFMALQSTSIMQEDDSLQRLLNATHRDTVAPRAEMLTVFLPTNLAFEISQKNLEPTQMDVFENHMV
jgi:hypothetical protein